MPCVVRAPSRLGEVSRPDPAQNIGEVVNRLHRGGGVVDRWRQGLVGDVDDNPDGKGWILLDRALVA